MLVFTSICMNYLPKALTLGKSIKKTNKDVKFFIVLLEREIPKEWPKEANKVVDKIILAKDLGFEDFDKFLFIHKAIRTLRELSTFSLEEYKEYIEYFYYDRQFNLIYSFWKKQEKDNTFYDWAKPSPDHIIPKSRGGGNEKENIHFLTVFENLAKRDMTLEEWNNFKIKTNTSSNYFIEKIEEVMSNEN